jgi:hypothetical protein
MAGMAGMAGSSGAGAPRARAARPPVARRFVARDPNAFVHPGGLHKRSDMDRMRYLVAAGVEPWAAAYQKLRADALASPTYAVRGDPTWTQVSRDGGVHSLRIRIRRQRRLPASADVDRHPGHPPRAGSASRSSTPGAT